jgi:hypothetical protein
MGIPHHARPAATLGAIACLLLAACSTSPAPATSKPKPGTPAFFWLTAREAVKQGDYVKATSLFADLAAGKSEYAEKARPMAALFSHGLTHAYMDLADTYAAGAKKARTNQAMFYRLTGEYRTKAKNAGMRYAEMARLLNASLPPDKEAILSFQLPEGPAADPGQYQKISAGLTIPVPEVADVEAHIVRHEMMLTALVFLGSEKQVDLGRSLYKEGEARVPAQTLLLAMARGLYETAEMFGPKKLSQPSSLRTVLLTEAGTALGKVKESKESKELGKKIKDAEKSLTIS